MPAHIDFGIWDDQKHFHRTFASNVDGSFSFSLFPGDTYFLSTDNGLGLVDQVYPSI